MNKLAERVKQARELRGIATQKALADLIGVSQQAIQKIESGHTTQSRYLNKLANVLGVTRGWLLGDAEATELQIKESAAPLYSMNAPQNKRVHAPTAVAVLTPEQLIAHLDKRKKPHALSNEKIWVMDVESNEDMLAFSVSGDAMYSKENPRKNILDGDKIIVRCNAPLQPNPIVLARLPGNNFKIRQLIKDGNDSYLVAYNKDYERIKLDRAMAIVGVAILLVRIQKL